MCNRDRAGARESGDKRPFEDAFPTIRGAEYNTQRTRTTRIAPGIVVPDLEEEDEDENPVLMVQGMENEFTSVAIRRERAPTAPVVPAAAPDTLTDVVSTCQGLLQHNGIAGMLTMYSTEDVGMERAMQDLGPLIALVRSVCHPMLLDTEVVGIARKVAMVLVSSRYKHTAAAGHQPQPYQAWQHELGAVLTHSGVSWRDRHRLTYIFPVPSGESTHRHMLALSRKGFNPCGLTTLFYVDNFTKVRYQHRVSAGGRVRVDAKWAVCTRQRIMGLTADTYQPWQLPMAHSEYIKQLVLAEVAATAEAAHAAAGASACAYQSEEVRVPWTSHHQHHEEVGHRKPWSLPEPVHLWGEDISFNTVLADCLHDVWRHVADAGEHAQPLLMDKDISTSCSHTTPPLWTTSCPHCLAPGTHSSMQWVPCLVPSQWAASCVTCGLPCSLRSQHSTDINPSSGSASSSPPCCCLWKR